MALTGPRANPYINPDPNPGESYLVAASGLAYAGGMVGINSAGYLTRLTGPAVNNSAFRFRGVSHETWSNPSPGANGAFSARVDRPQIMQGLKNLGTDPVAIADVGNTVYAEDDETIRKTSNTNTRCAVGTLQAINTDGTVDVKPLQP